jgi:Cu-Zn family superoxide dismutase
MKNQIVQLPTEVPGGLESNLKKHGKWGVGEYHKGDIGNFTADANGGNNHLTTDEWNIGSGDPTKDILGKD